jgi:hypothetical protein
MLPVKNGGRLNTKMDVLELSLPRMSSSKKIMKQHCKRRKTSDKEKKRNGQDSKLKKKQPVQQKRRDAEEKRRKHGNDSRWKRRRRKEDDRNKKNLEGEKLNVEKECKRKLAKRNWMRKRKLPVPLFLHLHLLQHLLRNHLVVIRYLLHLLHRFDQQQTDHCLQIKLSILYQSQATDPCLIVQNKPRIQEVSSKNDEVQKGSGSVWLTVSVY